MPKLPHVLLALSITLSGSAFASGPSDDHGKRPPTVETMHEIASAYALPDGRVARVLILDDRLYIDMNGRDRLELLAVSEDTFATRHNEISIKYSPDAGGAIAVEYNQSTKAATPHAIGAKDRQVL